MAPASTTFSQAARSGRRRTASAPTAKRRCGLRSNAPPESLLVAQDLEERSAVARELGGAHTWDGEEIPLTARLALREGTQHGVAEDDVRRDVLAIGDLPAQHS